MTEIKERNHHEHDIGHCDDAGFSRRELTSQNAAHDYHRNHQRNGGFFGCDSKLAEGRALALDPDWSEEVAVDHQPDADQDARHDAGQKQPADRDIAGGAIDHRHDARRNEVSHGRGRGDQRGGETAIVALAGHFRSQRACEHRDIGGR